jgi:hypothetical protein
MNVQLKRVVCRLEDYSFRSIGLLGLNFVFVGYIELYISIFHAHAINLG